MIGFREKYISFEEVGKIGSRVVRCPSQNGTTSLESNRAFFLSSYWIAPPMGHVKVRNLIGILLRAKFWPKGGFN